MAKARTTVDLVESSDVEDMRRAEELAQLNDDEGGEVFRAIEEMRSSQGTTVIIVKLTPEAEAGHVDTIPVAEFSLETMKERYGAGTYKVRVRGPKGLIPGGGNIKISSVGIKRQPKEATGDLGAILDAMNRQQTENRERNNRLMELAIPGALGIIAAMVGKSNGPDLAGLLTVLKPAPGPSLADITATMANLQALNGNQKTDPMDSILRVMEAVKNLNGGGDSGGQGESNWLDVVRDLVKEAVPAVKPMLEGLAAQANQRQQQQTPLVIRPPAPRVAGVVSAPIIPPSTDVGERVAENSSVGPAVENTDMMSLVMPTIRSALARILSWSKADRDPQIYSTVFLDETPSWIANYLTPQQTLEYLRHPQWFEKICEINPELKDHLEWCDEFRQELIGLIEDGMKEDSETPAQIIDTTHGDTE